MNELSDSSEPFDRNSETYRRLVDTIAKGAILFVGAGSSCRLGYPSWGALLTHLAASSKRVAPEKGAEIDAFENWDGLLRADNYREILGKSNYFDELRTLFAPRIPPHDVFHVTLVEMPFKHVLTTNYDSVLESAHAESLSDSPVSFDMDEWERQSEFRQSHTDRLENRQYLHVHGSIRRPEGIVLCKRDFDSRYEHETRAVSLLTQMLTIHRFVFVGFSLEDEDLKYIIRKVCASLGLKTPRHFALLARPDTPNEESEQRERLIGMYGIEPLYFENSARDYKALEPMVLALYEDVRAREEAMRKDDVNRLLREQPQLVESIPWNEPEFRKVAEQHLPGSLRTAGAMALEDAGVGDDSTIDAEIDAAFKLVKLGNPDAAVEEFEAVRVRHESLLSNKHRYRIDANIGNALYSAGKYDEASELYLRSVGYYRVSREARAIEVLGYLLQGNSQRAAELAAELCESEPDYARAYAFWVKAQSNDVDFETIEARVPEELLHDEELLFAMSDMARRTGNTGAQLLYAQETVAASPEWPVALSNLGCALLASHGSRDVFEVEEGLPDEDLVVLSEAEIYFTKAIELTPATDPSGQLAGVYYNRSLVRRLMGRAEGARTDLHEAFRRTSGDPTIVRAYATEAEAPNEISDALTALTALPSDVSDEYEHLFVHAVVLSRRGQSDDLEQALALVRRLSLRLTEVDPSSMRSDIVRLGLRLLVQTDRKSEGPDFVKGLPADAITKVLMSLYMGRAELSAGGEEDAASHVQEAIRLIDEDTTYFIQREAALLAQDCGLHLEAFGIWEALLSPESTGPDTLHLVRCAFVAGEWKTLLKVCERVRAAGRCTREYLEIETQVLVNSRERNRARVLLQDWMQQNPDDKLVRLHLSALALEDGLTDLAEFDARMLPSVAELEDAEQGAALVHVLLRSPAPERALEAAYDLYRRFPDQLAAHRLLVFCIFDQGGTRIEIERPEVVGRNTAVCIRRKSGPSRWIYVEHGTGPAVTREEYGESHPLIKALWGKKGGDSFEYMGHQYEIMSVENRMIRRVHEICARSEEDFPDSPLVRLFKLPADPPADAPIEEKLGDLLPELKRQEEQSAQLESMYRRNELPLASIATVQGRPLFELVRDLASSANVTLTSNDGDRVRLLRALKLLGEARTVVLDSTALAGALVIGLLDYLPRFGHKFLVPRAVVDEIQRMSLDLANSRSPRGRMGLDRGQFFLIEVSAEQRVLEVKGLERVLQFIEEHCDVVDGAATLDFSADLRGQLKRVVGEASTDALALAKKRDGVLWTDDFGLGAMASGPDLGIQTVWTQAVLIAARESRRILAKEYCYFLGRLVETGYAFVTVTAQDILNVMRNAHWSANTSLGSAIIRLLRDQALMGPNNMGIIALAVGLIWHECPKRRLARNCIAGILDGMGRAGSGRELAALVYRDASLDKSQIREARSLKRMLRSWRSRDGEFKPKAQKRRLRK